MNLLLFTGLLICSLTGTHLEVVSRFTCKPCSKFFYRDTEPKLKMQAGYRRICQKHTIDQDREFFATLYDTKKKIPVYSAYLLNIGATRKRPRYWNIEPQLECRTLGKYQERSNNEDLEVENQASNTDYRGSGFDRGHLNPNGYQDGIDRAATFTLTNVVPQYGKFNQGPWRKAEEAAFKVMASSCFGNSKVVRPFVKVHPDAKAYFITGAVPGEKSINNKGVNIPKITFTAACCVDPTRDEKFSFGFYGNNTADAATNQVRAMNVSALQKFLTKEWKTPKDIQFFSDDGDCNAQGSDRYIEQLTKLL